MTDDNYQKDEQRAMQPQQGTDVPPSGEPVPASEQPTAKIPKVAGAAAPGPSPATPQPTVVMPQAPRPPAPGQSEAPASGLVPPPVEQATPSADIDWTASDTQDTTLTDITLSGAEGNAFVLWLRGMKTRLDPRRGYRSGPPPTKRGGRRHWGLRPWQWALVGVGALVLLFAVFVTVDAALYYNKIHHGISVADQDLSRMNNLEAEQTLASLVEEVQEQPITLKSSDNQTWTVLPSDLGVTMDVPQAVSNATALTREGNVFTDLGRKIALYFSAKDLPLQGTVDDAEIDRLLTMISDALEVPAINATLTVVNGSIQIVDGTPGATVDQQALRNSLTDLLLTLHSTELAIPMMALAPDLEAADVEDVLGQAHVMISDDLLLTYEGETLVTIPAEELLTYLIIDPESKTIDSKPIPTFSAEKMVALFDDIGPQVGTSPEDAYLTMDLDAKEPYPLVVVEGVYGEGLDREGTAAALAQAAMRTVGRTAEVVLMPVEPEVTTEDVQALGIKDLLGDYETTPYWGSRGRQTNVRLATEKCSGVLLAPGEEFDTDERLGIRNAANGWALAPGITGFGELRDVYGGGICQVSTTLWNAVLESGLKIAERWNHSIYIGHYPAGRDATVTAGGKNMRFVNDTDHYVFLYGWSTGVRTRFWVWGVDDGRDVRISTSGFKFGTRATTNTIINKKLPVGTEEEIFAGQDERTIVCYRTIVYADGTKRDEGFTSHYPMMPTVVETNPAPETTTTEAPTTTSTTEAP